MGDTYSLRSLKLYNWWNCLVSSFYITLLYVFGDNLFLLLTISATVCIIIFYVSLLQLLNMHVEHITWNPETHSRKVFWDSISGLWNSNNGSCCWINTPLTFTQASAYTPIWSLLRLLKGHYQTPAQILKPFPCLRMLYLLMQLAAVFRNSYRCKSKRALDYEA
jgi:hypothetical protein